MRDQSFDGGCQVSVGLQIIAPSFMSTYSKTFPSPTFLVNVPERGACHLVVALLLLWYELTEEIVGSRVDVPNPNSVAKAREVMVFRG